MLADIAATGADEAQTGGGLEGLFKDKVGLDDQHVEAILRQALAQLHGVREPPGLEPRLVDHLSMLGQLGKGVLVEGRKDQRFHRHVPALLA